MLEYPAAEFFYESADVVAGVVVPEGELIPKSEESYNHTARVCKIVRQQALYTVRPTLQCAGERKFEMYRKLGIGGSSAWTVTAEPGGLRRWTAQSGRHGFHPRTVALDKRQSGRRHGRRATPRRTEPHLQCRSGFRLSLVWRGRTRTVEYKNDTPPANVVSLRLSRPLMPQTSV